MIRLSNKFSFCIDRNKHVKFYYSKSPIIKEGTFTMEKQKNAQV